MEIRAILKKIALRNNDIDSYVVAQFEIDNHNLDLNQLKNLSHKAIKLTLQVDE